MAPTESRIPAPKLIRPLRDFLHNEAAGGIVLVAAATIAMIWANSPWSESYQTLWNTVISIDVGDEGVHLTLKEWINDGLMAIFFFVVGLEIKRELVEGELSDTRQAALPALAALGGMVVPAAVYLAFTIGTPDTQGWGIPMATDIALAVGVIGLLGKRVPPAGKVFILALAIVDDIGAIAVIAIAYTEDLSLMWVGVAVAMFVSVLVAQRVDIRSIGVYIVIGAVMWFALHEAGIHATLAGVIMGLLAPAVPRVNARYIDIDEIGGVRDVASARRTVTMARESVSVVEWLENRLHPLSSFVIVPLFALANAGIEVTSEGLADTVNSRVAMGIAAGLVIGKPVGVTLATWIGTRLGLSLPPGVTMKTVIGLGAVAGIGFTVALFITELAFTSEVIIDEAKLSILFASLVAALLGAAALVAFAPDRSSADPDDAPTDTNAGVPAAVDQGRS